MEPDEPDSEEEQIGFHKGALSTLTKEREELNRMLSIVEQLMQMHISSLKDLGVDLEEQAEEAEDDGEDDEETPPIEDLLE